MMNMAGGITEGRGDDFDLSKWRKSVSDFEKYNTKKNTEEERDKYLDFLKKQTVKQNASPSPIKPIRKGPKVSILKKLVVEFIIDKGKVYHFYDQEKGWREVTRDFFMDEMEDSGGYRLEEETDTHTIYILSIEN